MGKKTFLKPVPIDYKFEEREARKSLRIALQERCKEGKSFKTDANVSKAKSRFERLREDKAKNIARQRTISQLDKIESRAICKKISGIGNNIPYQPQPIIINTGAAAPKKQGAILGVAIGVAVVWWYFSSSSSEGKPDSERGKTTAAVFNKNPGNVKKGKFKYPMEITPEKNEYRQYANWSDGYAGLIIHLRRYAAGFVTGVPLDTIRKIIYKYAPPTDGNKTETYIKSLVKETGFGENEKLNFFTRSTCLKMCKAIAKNEDGQSPRDDETIVAGFNRAAKYNITK